MVLIVKYWFLESLKTFETSLQQKHDRTVADLEDKKKKELEERQKVFHEAFKNDLEIFKNFGTIPSKFFFICVYTLTIF